jgi:hypothetical protein
LIKQFVIRKLIPSQGREFAKTAAKIAQTQATAFTAKITFSLIGSFVLRGFSANPEYELKKRLNPFGLRI